MKKILLASLIFVASFVGTYASIARAQSIPQLDPWYVLNGTITQIISGTPVKINGNLTVTGTCTGCGGSGGIATSSPGLTSGQPVYATGVSTIASVASSTFLTSIGGQAALSFPLSIANGGTATTSAVTNGVYYYNGTNAEADSLLTFTGTTFTAGNSAGSVALVSSSGGNTGIQVGGFTGSGYSGAARLTFASSGQRTFKIGNISNSQTTNDFILLGTSGLTTTNSASDLVGINATSTPFAFLSVAGSAGGTTPLFAISSSTVGFATTTLLEVDANGNTTFGDTSTTNIGAVSGGLVNIGTGSGGTVVNIGTQTAGAGIRVGAGTAPAIAFFRAATNNTSAPLFKFFNGGLTATAGMQTVFADLPSFAQSTTAGYTAFQIQATETTLGTGNHYLIEVGTSTANDLWDIDNTGHLITSGSKPVLSACGSANNISGNDNNGTIMFTGTLVTACTMTFATPVPTGQTVECTATGGSTAFFTAVTATSSTAATFGTSASLSSGTIYYECRRHQ